MLSMRWNRFRVCSACDEISSAYAQHAMKFVPRMLSIIWMLILKWVGISPYAEHTRKLVTRWLSTSGNWLLIGWAYAEIGYSLAEHTQNLVTRWLSIRETRNTSISISRDANSTITQQLINFWGNLPKSRQNGISRMTVLSLKPVLRIRDPVPFWPLDPGSGIGFSRIPDPKPIYLRAYWKFFG